jgi:hypothetical protein
VQIGPSTRRHEACFPVRSLHRPKSGAQGELADLPPAAPTKVAPEITPFVGN